MTSLSFARMGEENKLVLQSGRAYKQVTAHNFLFFSPRLTVHSIMVNSQVMKRTFQLLTILTLATALVGCDQPGSIQPTSADGNTGRFVLDSVSITHVSGTTPNLYVYIVRDTQGSNNFVVFSAGSSSVASQPISTPVLVPATVPKDVRHGVQLEDNK